MELENYVYKKEVDWSTLMEGFTLPLDNQVIFLRNMESFLQRGESKLFIFFMNGKTIEDKNSGIEKRLQIVKIHKLNRKIGENLKLLYGYRCRICGQVTGEKYGSRIAENNANNRMIVCLDHHSIIHDANPVFDWKRMIYRFIE